MTDGRTGRILPPVPLAGATPIPGSTSPRRTGAAVLSAARWTPVAAWPDRHAYPEGQAPRDAHAAAYGPMVAHRYGLVSAPQITDAVVAVHSTARRSDGWSYVLVQLQAWPAWVTYFHHAPTGRRVRQDSGGPATLAHALARVFEVPH